MSVPVAEHGQGGAEVVVLLHGWPGGPATWRRLAPLLATRFRVLILELRDPDLPSQADAVRALLAERRIERYAVVGHGHGGGVAQLLAAGEPSPAAFVLLDPIAFDHVPPVDLAPRDFVQRAAVEFATIADEDVTAYERFGTDTAPPAPFDLSAAAERLAASDAPIFLLWGEQDAMVPLQIGERLGDMLPGSTLGLVPESGHFLLDDAFDPVGVMILEYLRVRYEGAPHGHEGLVMLQLERRPPWADLAPYEEPDGDPAPPTAGQEVGPHA